MSCRTTCLALLVLLHTPVLHAEENLQPIYESMDGMKIGRVFLSPGERMRLDAVRHLEPAPGGPAGPIDPTAAGPEPEPEPPTGYGFIQVSGKAPRVFRDGDFVRAAAADAGVDDAPPGVLIRHEDSGDEDGPAQ